MNTLSRVCGAPTEQAETTDHSASNPISQRSPRTRPKASASESRAATFSSRTRRGRSSRMIRANSGHSHRSSLVPLRSPAELNGWHGKPPQMRSTAVSLSAPTLRTSSCLGTSGQWFARTLRHHGSISTCQAQRIPARSRPRSMPPMPENSDPNVMRGPRCAGGRGWRATLPVSPGCHRLPALGVAVRLFLSLTEGRMDRA